MRFRIRPSMSAQSARRGRTSPYVKALRPVSCSPITSVWTSSVPSALLQEVAGRHPIAAAVVHGADPHPGARTSYEVFPAPRRAETVRVGRLEVTLSPTSDRIVVEARRGG